MPLSVRSPAKTAWLDRSRALAAPADPMLALARVTRRDLILGCAAGSAVIYVGGCGYYAPEQGAAYAPWQFPAERYSDPHLLLVHAAILAANPHNTQPWIFRLAQDQISLFADRSRRLGAMDPLGRELMIGLGCALENLLIAARHHGYRAELSLAPNPADPTHVAHIGLASGQAEAQAFYTHLGQRRTNRGPYTSAGLAPALLSELAVSSAQDSGVRVHWLVDDTDKARFASMCVAATRAIVADVTMSQASYRWYRHSRAEIEQHRDGLTLDAQGLKPAFAAVAKVLPRTSRATADDYWIENTEKVHCKHVAAFGILSTTALNEPTQLLSTGRVYQRLHLAATARGLAMQPLNQAAERRDRELERGLPVVFGAQLASLVGGPRHAQMLFRIGHPTADAHHSPRRGPASVVG
jgi:nitroreductase